MNTLDPGSAGAALAEQQLDLLTRMASLDPPPCIMGGYAEDALLAGTVTRPHADTQRIGKSVGKDRPWDSR